MTNVWVGLGSEFHHYATDASEDCISEFGAASEQFEWCVGGLWAKDDLGVADFDVAEECRGGSTDCIDILVAAPVRAKRIVVAINEQQGTITKAREHGRGVGVVATHEDKASPFAASDSRSRLQLAQIRLPEFQEFEHRWLRRRKLFDLDQRDSVIVPLVIASGGDAVAQGGFGDKRNHIC